MVVFLRAHVEVESQHLRRGDASVATKAAEARGATVGEAHVVGVVGIAGKGELVAIVEVVGYHIAQIALVGAIACSDGAKPPVVHAFLHGEVDNCLILAVVHASESCQVALAVNDL